MIDAPAMSMSISQPRSLANRVTALAGLAFAISVIAQNTILTRGTPLADASVSEISNFYATNEAALSLAIGLVAINLTFLFVFAAGMYERARAALSGSMLWPRLAIMGTVLLGGAFSLVAVTQAVLIVNANTLADQPVLTQMMWDLHSAAFALNMVALGIAFGSFAQTAHAMGIAPRWLTYLATAGAIALIVASTAVIPSINGSPVGLIGFAGFGTWMLWLLVTSIRLLREPSA